MTGRRRRRHSRLHLLRSCWHRSRRTGRSSATELAYVILNRYPYNNGHLMVVPSRHVATLATSTPDELAELMRLTRHAEMALTEAYTPQGINVGINLGRPAGAGIVDHLHVHLVPRWTGDTSFMSVSATRACCPRNWARRRRGCGRSSNGSPSDDA